jgi:hypothetical protein
MIAKGGIGLSEEAMITFYTQRMMQHSLRHIRVYCTGPGEVDDSMHTRGVYGWGSSGTSRYQITVYWAGSVQEEWLLNQSIDTDPHYIDEYPPGKVLEHRCRFVSSETLLTLAATYGYQTQVIHGDRWDPDISARPKIPTIPRKHF